MRCGDGLTSGEACDDGNASSGDGCSASCAVESGFACTEQIELSSSVKMKVTYRDYRSRNESGGHPLSVDSELPTMALRFFGLRDGELWGSDDPDAFPLEDVMMIDTRS